MRHYFIVLITVVVVILGSSCRKDLEYEPSNGNLEFSKDTVFLDTVFTNIGSSTRTLKIYNRSNNDLEIPLIHLAKGEESNYRLNVDGVAGNTFTNIPIFAKDSLFIFIETTIPNTSVEVTEFLYTDAIQFDPKSNLQEVHLVTLAKEAVFIYPKTVANGSKETIILNNNPNGEEIRVAGRQLTNEELYFTNDKPYVIYGYAAVPKDKELVIDAGARLHFHEDSGLFISPGAKLTVAGKLSSSQEILENEVIFEGDRLENEYATTTGQWGAIWIAAGSTENSINHLTIKNATIGLRIEGDGKLQTPTLTLKNTQIYNSASTNLWAKTAFVTAENIVLGSAESNTLNCTVGGKYSFVHCTFANYWTNGFRNGAAVAIDNFGGNETADLRASFINCILDGHNLLELNLNANTTNTFNATFEHCAIKFKDDSNQFKDNTLYDFENLSTYDSVYLNEEMSFINAYNNDFRIDNTSKAVNKGTLEGAQNVPLDILGVQRSIPLSLGAYQALDE